MISSEWMMVGDAKRPSEPRGPRFPLLRHTDGRYVLVVDERGTQLRVAHRYGRAHDQTRNKAAVALGKRTSPAKAAAARRNGRRGGNTERAVAVVAFPSVASPQDRDHAIRQLYRQGYRKADIARACGLSRQRTGAIIDRAS